MYKIIIDYEKEMAYEEKNSELNPMLEDMLP